MTLDQLRGTGSGPDTQAGWAAAAARASADGQPGWILDPATAEAYACDAHITPIVTGHIDRVAVALAVRTFMNAAQRAKGAGHHAPDGLSATDGHPASNCCFGGCTADQSTGGGHKHGPPMSFAELQDLFLRQAIEALSGPTGLAAHLRAAAGAPACSGVSLPLDVGAITATIPPHLRRAVIARDRHCAFPGCHQPPAACQVHHIIPRSQGGTTSLTNLVMLCAFHHLFMIHRRGWALALNCDGTATATSPDGQRTFHSHSPPTAAAAL